MKTLNETVTPIWISHRGLAHSCDENTLASFQAAVEAGFHCIETDLRTTEDGKIILFHDPEIKLKSGKSFDIQTTVKSKIESLNLDHGGKIPSLNEFMQNFSNQNWAFDIKPETSNIVTDKILDLLAKNQNLIHKIIFLFWDKKDQRRLVEKFPEATFFARQEEIKRALYSILFKVPCLGGIEKNKIYAVPPIYNNKRLLTKKLVSTLHKRGAKALCYLPETKEELSWGLDAKVDYVLSNYSLSELT